MREFAFVNGTGSTIPAGAALRPTGVNAAGFTTVAQANADSSMYVIFNAPVDVANGAYGVAFGWDGGVVPVAVDPADEPYTSADTFGTKSGDWRLRKGFKGFRLPTASVQGVANAVPDPAGTGGTALDTRNSDNTDQITATTRIVASLTDGVEFVASGTVNTLTTRDASPTQRGVVSTVYQEFGGAKLSRTGTNGGEPGWWVIPTTAQVAALAGQPIRSLWSTWLAGAGVTTDLAQGGVLHFIAEEDDYPVPMDPAQTFTVLVSNYNVTGGGDYDTALSLVTISPVTDVTGLQVIAAGHPNQSAADSYTCSFGVFRLVSGVWTLRPGLETTLSACKVGTFQGGILTGVSVPDTATPLSTDYITFCRDGTAYKCTLAALKTMLDAIPNS